MFSSTFVGVFFLLSEVFPLKKKKKKRVHKEFSFPQLQNKYLLIISNWPLFLTNR